ncbi:hypothetical protein FA13DRAFT_1081114 [Coprinellus micaceus]|uniref:RING-type domain-containing protein n=1 Tax=Coprinellus micaceus TaxID=71717 RepID=A0A4Y7TT62_COPMI|nr:hypothetical protein FA13DRAFT_1081114 [Coprinellus micaceus]
MIQAAEDAKAPNQPLIDLEDKAVVLPNLLEDLILNTPPQPAPPPLPRRSEDSALEEQLLGCEYCPKQVPVRRISQIPFCLHLVCHTCLLNHVEKQLFDSYFPIKCPMCLLLEEQSEVNPESRVPIAQGVVTLEIMQNFQALAPSTFTIFQEFQISSQSSQVFCPQCQETMLVDRAQYLQQSIVTCPRQTCNHRWCKSCFKDMTSASPGSANMRHKCKPEKTIGVRACPECGYQGRRIAGDNLIPCRGVGCRIQFCFKCGETIVDGSTKPQDIPQQIQIHYGRCSRVTKDDKCTVQ